MTKSKIFAAMVLGIACNAQAAQNSVSGTQSFGPSLAGYGFKYSVSWASDVAYDLSVSGYGDYYDKNPPWTYGFLSVTLALSPQSSVNLVGMTALDLAVSANVSFINLATGAPGLPPGFYSTTTKEMGKSWFNFYNMPETCTTPAGTVELRFSNPKCTVDSSVVVSNALPDGRLAAVGDGIALVQARSGHYLSPSDDPNCASLSCMTLRRDAVQASRIFFTAGATVGAVPEPSTFALLSFGGLVLGFMARRRRMT